MLACLLMPVAAAALTLEGEDAVSASEQLGDFESAASASADNKAISVVQPRDFTKAGKVEITPGLAVIPTDIFMTYLPLDLRIAYHFNEAVSLELSSSFLGCFSSESGDHQERTYRQHCLRFPTPLYDKLTVNEQEITQIRNVSLKELQVARFYLNPVWTPFYGKFSALNAQIVHYDFSLTAGVGVLLTETPDETDISNRFINAAFEGNLGFGLRFMFREFFGLRFDFRQFLYMKQEGRGLGTSSEFSLGLSFMI